MKHRPAKAHRLRRFLLYGVTAVVVTAAVLLSLARLLIADIGTYRYDVEQIASAFLGHPVRIESLDARFEGLTPTLVFRGVRMLDRRGQRELAGFREARLSIAVWDSLMAERVVPARFVIEGIDLVVTRQKDGSIRLQGIDLKTLKPRKVDPAAAAELGEWLFRRSKLAIRHSSIVWQDYRRGGARRHFRNVDLQLINRGDRHHLRAEVSLPRLLGQRFVFALSVQGDMRLPSTWIGRMYLEGNGINLPEWGDFLQLQAADLRRGQADVRVWSEFDRGRLRRLSGDLTLAGLLLEGDFLRAPLVVDLVGGLFDWRNTDDGWALAVDQLRFISGHSVWPASRFSLRQQRKRGDARGTLRITAGYLRLEDVGNLLVQTRLIPERLRAWLEEARPSGDVRDLAVSLAWPNWQPGDALVLQARLQQLAMAPTGRVPGLAGFSGQLWSDARHGHLRVDSRQMRLHLPRLFRAPLVVNRAEGAVRWQWLGARGWQIRSPRLLLDTPDLQTRSRFLLQFEPDRPPWLDLQTRFADGDGRQVSTYLPVGIMKPALIRWLDESIREGRVLGGGAVIRGRLGRFRDLLRDGQFRVDFDAEDLVLRYARGWPALTRGRASASFTRTGIDIAVHAARILTSEVGPARVRIPAYHQPRLAVEGRMRGPFADVARFMVESRLAGEAAPALQAMRITGRYRGQLHFELPLAKGQRQAGADWRGQLELQDVGLRMYGRKLDISGLHGKVDFDREGERARELQGRIYGRPAVFDIFTRPLDGGRQTSIVARAELDSEAILERLDLRPAGRVRGRSAWQGVFSFGRDAQGRPQPPALQLATDLAGVELRLPPPFAKAAEQERPLSLDIRFVDRERLDVNYRYGQKACGVFRTGSQGIERAALRFGDLQAVPLPPAARIVVSGRLEGVRFADWTAAWRDLVPERERQARPLPWQLNLDVLELLALDDAGGAGKALPDPDTFPPVEGTIRQFRYAGKAVGVVALRSQPVRRGLRIDWLDINGASLQIHLAGSWKRTLLGHRSRIELTVSSANLEQALVRLQAPRVIEDGILHLNGELQWRGALHQPDPATLNGRLRLKLTNGSFTNIDPGPARLLGLLNLSTIPRLLGGDNRKGFNFDEVDGRFELNNGNMRIAELTIRGPLAQIDVQGHVFLADGRIDQQVTVIPNVGGSLPVATGLAFGLQVGALVALLDQLVGKELNKAGARKYRITGKLDKPIVTRLDKPPAEAAEEDDDG